MNAQQLSSHRALPPSFARVVTESLGTRLHLARTTGILDFQPHQSQSTVQPQTPQIWPLPSMGAHTQLEHLHVPFETNHSSFTVMSIQNEMSSRREQK